MIIEPSGCRPSRGAPPVAVRSRHAAQPKVERSPELPVGEIQPGSLGIRTEEHQGVAHLFLSGELDIATKPFVEKVLGDAEHGHIEVVVDFKGVQFMDCSGIRLFLGAAERAGSTGHRLQIVNCPASVRRVFDLTCTDFLLKEGSGGSRVIPSPNRP